MKKLLALVLCLITLLLTACNNEPATSSDISSVESEVSSNVSNVEEVSSVESVASNTTSKTTTQNNGGSISNTVNVPTNNITPFGKANGTVTKTAITHSTEHFNFKIDANVFLIENPYSAVEKLYTAIEKASGLKFNNSGNVSKITIVVTREGLSGDAELGQAYAIGSTREVYVSPGDFLIGKNYTLIHELSHILQSDNCGKSFVQVLGEGFAEYNAYKVLTYLKSKDKALYSLFFSDQYVLSNMRISNINKLYAKPITHWMENQFPFEYAFNQDYAVGIRLMYYLDKKFGSYTKWITEYNTKYYDPGVTSNSNKIDMDKQIQVLKDTYGNGVYDGFYTWFKSNGSLFNVPEISVSDLTHTTQLNFYPDFHGNGYYEGMVNPSQTFKYNNLTVSLVEYRHYMTTYKKKDLSKLQLVNNNCVKIALYDKNGKFIRGTNLGLISLKDVYYVKFVGSGKAEVLIKIEPIE